MNPNLETVDAVVIWYIGQLRSFARSTRELGGSGQVYASQADADAKAETIEARAERLTYEIRSTASADHAIGLLNELLTTDRETVTTLMFERIPCSEALADHPTVQVGHQGDDPDAPLELGMLGIINGIFGAREGDGHGFICAHLGDGPDDPIQTFTRTDSVLDD